MAALVFVAVAVSALVINFGIVQAAGGDVKASINAKLKLQQVGDDVVVNVKAKGLTSNADFTVRAYIDTVTDCVAAAGNALIVPFVATGTSDDNGKLKLSGTILDKVVDDVGSVSIRSFGPPPFNPPVVCFQNTT